MSGLSPAARARFLTKTGRAGKTVLPTPKKFELLKRELQAAQSKIDSLTNDLRDARHGAFKSHLVTQLRKELAKARAEVIGGDVCQ